MRSRGIWLTVLMRGCKLNSLTPSNGGTTAPISYTHVISLVVASFGVSLGGAEMLLSHSLLITVKIIYFYI